MCSPMLEEIKNLSIYVFCGQLTILCSDASFIHRMLSSYCCLTLSFTVNKISNKIKTDHYERGNNVRFINTLL